MRPAPAPRPRQGASSRRAQGFTLVEVLVALVIMAVLAAMAWQGVDGMARARSATQERSDRALRVNTVVAQWEQDLQALYDTRVVPAIAFDGAVLRLTRQTPEGVQVVAWALHGGRWMRWAGRSVTRGADLQESWLQSQQLQGSEPEQLLALEGLAAWQVYFYRGNAWSNAQSSADVAVAAPVPGAASAPAALRRELLPKAVRVVLTFNGALQGNLSRDVILAPQQP